MFAVSPRDEKRQGIFRKGSSREIWRRVLDGAGHCSQHYSTNFPRSSKKPSRLSQRIAFLLCARHTSDPSARTLHVTSSRLHPQQASSRQRQAPARSPYVDAASGPRSWSASRHPQHPHPSAAWAIADCPAHQQTLGIWRYPLRLSILPALGPSVAFPRVHFPSSLLHGGLRHPQTR